MDLTVKEGVRGMDLAEMTKETTSFDDVMTNILATGKIPTDSEGLRNQQLALQNELKDAMNDGKIEEVVRIQAMLSSLPVRIKTAEVAEIKSNISSGNKRLDEIKEDFMEATRIRNQKHRIYLEKLKVMEAAGTDVMRVDFILSTLENEAESIRVARREYNQRLNNLMDAEL